MPVARRLAVAFAVIGLGVLSYAVPASATESRDSGACLTNPRPDQLIGTLDAQRGVATVRARAGVDLCADVWLSVYTVPDTWVGPDFDRTAVPQTLYRPSTPGRVTGTATTTLTAAVPTCGAVQIDLYTPPEITAVNDTTGHDGHLIQGYIWRWYADGQPLLCGVETSPPVPTPTETTATPTPTESTTAPTPTPTESTTAPTPTPTESTTPPPAPTDSTTPPTPTPAPTTPLSGLLPPGATPGPIVAVPTTPAPPAPPVLASTGSDATVPLLGIGGVLLVAGLGLSVLGRRRRTA